jgi:hypothetical protein
MSVKKDQLVKVFEKLETLLIIEHGGQNNEINEILAELRHHIDFILRQNKNKNTELNIHRGLELLHLLLVTL